MFLTYSAKRISSFFANFAAISEALNSNTVFKVLQTLRLFAFLIKPPKQLALLGEALNYTSNFHSIATQSNLFSLPPEHQALAAKPSIITQKTYRATTRRRSTFFAAACDLSTQAPQQRRGVTIARVSHCFHKRPRFANDPFAQRSIIPPIWHS